MKCETRACSAIGCICNTLQGTDNDVRKTVARGGGPDHSTAPRDDGPPTEVNDSKNANNRRYRYSYLLTMLKELLIH